MPEKDLPIAMKRFVSEVEMLVEALPQCPPAQRVALVQAYQSSRLADCIEEVVAILEESLDGAC